MNGNLIDSKKISPEDAPQSINDQILIINNNKIYVKYVNKESGVFVYNTNLEKVNSINYNDIISDSAGNIIDFDNDNVILELMDNNDTYLVRLDSDYKLVNKYKVEEEDINNRFTSNYLAYKKLKGDKINLVYYVDEENIDSVLLVFYK